MVEDILVTIDLTQCRCIDDLYREIQTKLACRAWYGDNLEALDRMLRDLLFVGDFVTIVRFERFCDIHDCTDVEFTQYVDKICDIFKGSRDRKSMDLAVRHVCGDGGDYTVLYKERVQVTLDFTQCKYIYDLYEQMRSKMDWDDDFGGNLDALWDILWGMPYRGDDFTILRPIQYRGIPYGDNVGFTEYVDKICELFQEAQDEAGITVQIRYTDENGADVSAYRI